MWFEQLEVRYISVATLEFAHVLDFLKLFENEMSVTVAFGMDKSEHAMALLPAVFASQPSRALWQEEQAEEENDSWKHLKTPRHTKSGGAAEVAAAERDVVHLAGQ